MASSEEATTVGLAKGTLVTISGLQSDAGKKLNGSLGVILSAPTMEAGVARYPVLIYAFKGGNLLRETLQRMIKEENLIADVDPTQNKVFVRAVMQHVSPDPLQGIWWLEQHYAIFPEEYPMGITYATVLREKGSLQQAADIMFGYTTHVDIPNDPNYFQFCYDFCIAFCLAKQHLDLALEYALKIPHDTGNPDDQGMAFEALREVLMTLNKLVQADTKKEHPELAQLNIQGCQRALERNSDNASLVIQLGAAYCLAGQNIEGAKLYRRALRMPLSPTEVPKAVTRRSLIVAQLQCPGMPLEGDFIVSVAPDQESIMYIKKEDREKFHVSRPPDGLVQLHAIAHGASYRSYPLPADPDDPEVFPPEFLAKLREDN